MTDASNVPAKPRRKGSRVMWALTGLVFIAAVCAWIALGVGLYMGVGFTPRLILATAAAVTTEATFWLTAATIGVSVFEARRRIWRYVTGRGGEAA